MTVHSWTARGALILTGLGICILAVGYTEAPSPYPLVELSELALQAASARATYLDRWQDRGIELIGVLALLWGIYGGRSIIPIPAGWSRAPTSAELRRARAEDPMPTSDGQ